MLQMAKDQGSQGGCGCLGCGGLLLGALMLGAIGMLFPSLDWNRVFAEMAQGARTALNEGQPQPTLPDPVQPAEPHPLDPADPQQLPSEAASGTGSGLTAEAFSAIPAGGKVKIDCPKCGRQLLFRKTGSNHDADCVSFPCDHCRKPVMAFEKRTARSWNVLPIGDRVTLGSIQTGGMFPFSCGTCGHSQWSYLPSGPAGGRVVCERPSCRHLLLWYERDESGKRRVMPGYFQGFSPDPSEKDWASIWLLQLARFRYNHAKLESRDPLWQTSASTWRTGTGVCRDSATLLADWLRSAGHDARIVTGQMRGGWLSSGDGHAWVVLVDGDTGKQYLLETTGESQESRMRTPPLASLKAGEYMPEHQIVPTGYRGREKNAAPAGEYNTGWYETPDTLRP